MRIYRFEMGGLSSYRRQRDKAQRKANRDRRIHALRLSVRMTDRNVYDVVIRPQRVILAYDGREIRRADPGRRMKWCLVTSGDSVVLGEYGEAIVERVMIEESTPTVEAAKVITSAVDWLAGRC